MGKNVDELVVFGSLKGCTRKLNDIVGTTWYPVTSSILAFPLVSPPPFQQVRHGVVMRDSDHDMEQAAGLPDLSSSSSSSEED